MVQWDAVLHGRVSALRDGKCLTWMVEMASQGCEWAGCYWVTIRHVTDVQIVLPAWDHLWHRQSVVYLRLSSGHLQSASDSRGNTDLLVMPGLSGDRSEWPPGWQPLSSAKSAETSQE